MTGVRYISVAEHSGYGLAAQGYLLALLRAGVEVEWLPLVSAPHGYAPWNMVEESPTWIAGLADGRSIDGYFGNAIRRTVGLALDCDAIVLHTTPEHWPRYLDPDRRNFGYTVWETDAPPPHWPDLMTLVDRVLVPSEFNKTVFRNAGVESPISVIPHIVRPGLEPPSIARADGFRERYGIPRGHMVFYSIEAWTARKTPWKTILAFLEAFTSDDPASLVIKTGPMGPRSGAAASSTSTGELLRELVSSYRKPAHVVLINHELPGDEIDLLHRLGDCYLSLTHSEGWGLSPFDAAAAGNPVIITGWGGHLEYLGNGWPYLIDFEMTPVMDAQGRGSYLPTQNWASPRMDHAVELVREVFYRQDAARTQGENLAERIRKQFSEGVIGRRLVDVLRGEA